MRLEGLLRNIPNRRLHSHKIEAVSLRLEERIVFVSLLINAKSSPLPVYALPM
jgi:hypothetical protein